MSDETGKWLPYNADGSAHDCRTNGQGQGQKQEKQQQSKQEISLEMVKRKLESLGIILDVERLMQQD